MAGGGDSKSAVLYALAVNAFMTSIKFVVASISGSGSMFAEAMHTLADTANQTLLFIGITKSDKPANQMFSYGYGVERFFYALMSAVGIFVLGCGCDHVPRHSWPASPRAHAARGLVHLGDFGAGLRAKRACLE